GGEARGHARGSDDPARDRPRHPPVLPLSVRLAQRSNAAAGERPRLRIGALDGRQLGLDGALAAERRRGRAPRAAEPRSRRDRPDASRLVTRPQHDRREGPAGGDPARSRARLQVRHSGGDSSTSLSGFAEGGAEARIVAQRLEVAVLPRPLAEARILDSLLEVPERRLTVAHERLDARQVVDEAEIVRMVLESFEQRSFRILVALLPESWSAGKGELPRRDAEWRAALPSDREHRGAVYHGARSSTLLGVVEEDAGPHGRVDLLAVDGERRTAGDYDIELLVV